MSTNLNDIQQMLPDELKNHIEKLAESYQVLINQEYTMSISENIDLQIFSAHNVKMQTNYNQLRDAIVQYNTKKYGDISEQTFPNLLSLKGYDGIKLYTPDYKDINPAPEPKKVTSPDISDLLKEFNDSLSTDSNLSSRRNSVDMSIDEINALLESTSGGLQPNIPISTISSPQLNDNPELNKLIASIKNDLSQLKQLLDTEKTYIKLMNQVAERNEPIEDIVIQQYHANINKISEIAEKLEIQLQNSKPQELELIKQQTNNFENSVEYDGQTFLIPNAEKLSEKTKNQMMEIRQKKIDQIVEQIKRERPQLIELFNEMHNLALELDQQLRNNNNNVDKLDKTMLNRVKTLNNHIRKAIDRYNAQLDELNPSDQEMNYIAAKTGGNTSDLINHRIRYPGFINEQLENLINPAPLTSHTQTNPGQSPLITPPNQTPPRPTTETVPPPNQNGNSSVNLSGRLVSNDWLDNKNLAEAIRKAMKEAIKDAVKNDPQFKSMNLTLNIKKIDLSTPQHPSSDLKGIEVTSNDPDKKIHFTATPEGVSGNSNSENLKAMSIEIVKNLEIRILHGATDLKINLGDCHPESVKKEFSELINKQLENMLQKNQGKPQFNNYSMEKLKLPVTPSVSGVIAPTNPTNDTSTQQRRLSSSL